MTCMVNLSGHRPVPALLADLERAGLKVEQVLDAIDVVTGKANEDAAPKLRKVEGVKSVEEEQAIDIGPPDKPSW